MSLHDSRREQSNFCPGSVLAVAVADVDMFLLVYGLSSRNVRAELLGVIMQVLAFQAVLKAAGVVCTVRDSRGDDEMAACGQLGNIDELNRPAPTLKPPLRFKDALVAA